MRKNILITLCFVLLGCAKQDSISVAHNELARFYNYSTVDWRRIDTLYYRPYNCDWPEGMEKIFNPEFPPELIPNYWHRLQNAKTYLHQKTLPLRIGASPAFINQLNRTEEALDTLFVHMVSQPYFMRLDVDCYEEIIPQEVTKCFELKDGSQRRDTQYR